LAVIGLVPDGRVEARRGTKKLERHLGLRLRLFDTFQREAWANLISLLFNVDDLVILVHVLSAGRC
jgi:hypothetical protein